MGERRRHKTASEAFPARDYLAQWGGVVRAAREARGLSLRQLDHLVGLSASSIQAFEAGRQWVSMAKFLHICAVLHVPLCHLLPDQTPPTIRAIVAVLLASPDASQQEVLRWLRSFQYIGQAADLPPATTPLCTES